MVRWSVHLVIGWESRESRRGVGVSGLIAPRDHDWEHVWYFI